ncbi:toll/interleukin-1 receptor domain-containing protein [Cohnella sp. WQ 127256]|uniref:toll/interleukin-1 receptor domain-containing protein n=1 Tax=Cohnella sp. WQ 127256 TaxID=2938790 RepID=UPI0021196704|nr:TIR domain-containing protein [Cohnella sp. WQ 127256]
MNRDIDVALSFAGEDREIVEELAAQLRSKKVRVFYDDYEKADLWGKDLYQYLSETYYSRAKFCLVFISSHYVKKLWTQHELKSAQAREFSQNTEYILPLRLDDTAVPGILPTLGFVDLRTHSIEAVVNLIMHKLGYTNGGYLSFIPLISNYPDTVLPTDLSSYLRSFIKEYLKNCSTQMEVDRVFNLVKGNISNGFKEEMIEHELLSNDNYLSEKGLNILYRLVVEGSRDSVESLVNDRSKYDKLAETIIESNLNIKVKNELLESVYRNDHLLFPVIIDVLYSESSINLAKRYKPELSYEQDIRNKLSSTFDLEYLYNLKARQLNEYINSNIEKIPESILKNFFQEYYLVNDLRITTSGFISIYEAVNKMDF